jgi:hypothetical protein
MKPKAKPLKVRLFKFLNSLQLGDSMAFLDLIKEKRITVKKLQSDFEDLGCKESALFAKKLGKIWGLK